MTTDEKIDQVLVEVEELIGWAEADVENSNESDAPEQAADDIQRLENLKEVQKLLNASYKG